MMILGLFWESCWNPKSFNKRCEFRVFLGRVLGGAFGKFRGFASTQLAGQGVPGKGRVGIKLLPKGMWVVGLKKDCKWKWVVD